MLYGIQSTKSTIIREPSESPGFANIAMAFETSEVEEQAIISEKVEEQAIVSEKVEVEEQAIISETSEVSDISEVVEAAGRFRIYLGACAGVGKTYAMLNEGHRRFGRGADVVIGFVEHHGRELTRELIEGLEVIERRGAEHRGSTFEEMNLDAILARHPRVALIDELAHTNVPGSGRNEKRWQDIMEILDAGIDVITTVNIQHLESIADAVEQMTGIKVRERVPDWVIRKADQIELVDASPESLRRRMLHGNIYAKEKVPQALTHFFRVDNLTALRELALRFLADETEETLLEYLKKQHSEVLWETTERIMVAVTNSLGTDILLRRAARIALRVKAELDVVHVVAGDATIQDERKTMDNLRELCSDLGGRWHEIRGHDIARDLIGFAQEHQITQIVLASSTLSWWQKVMGRGSVIRKVLLYASIAGIDVHVIALSRSLAGGNDIDRGTDGSAR